MFKIWGKQIGEDSPYVCAAARFHNRLGFYISCSVSPALMNVKNKHPVSFDNVTKTITCPFLFNEIKLK